MSVPALELSAWPCPTNGRGPAERDGLRIQFITAAEMVLISGGFPALNVKDVCRMAGLSLHLFYEVVGSKDALLAGMLEYQYTMAARHLRYAIDPRLPPVPWIWAFLHEMVDFSFNRLLDEPVSLFANNWYRLLSCYPDVAEKSITMLLTPLVSAVAEGRRQGVLDSANPPADARAIYHLVVGMVLDRPMRGTPTERNYIERTITRFVSHALGIDR